MSVSGGTGLGLAISQRLVDYNSDFKPECDNIHTMRRPLFTIKVVRTLNDEEEEKLQTGRSS